MFIDGSNKSDWFDSYLDAGDSHVVTTFRSFPMPRPDPFKARATLKTKFGSYTYFDLNALKRAGIGHVEKLPFSIRVLLESMLRNLDGFIVTADDVSGLANWNAKKPAQEEIPFMPGRVILQDFT